MNNQIFLRQLLNKLKLKINTLNLLDTFEKYEYIFI